MGRDAASGGTVTDHRRRTACRAVDGPAPEYADEMKALYEAKFRP